MSLRTQTHRKWGVAQNIWFPPRSNFLLRNMSEPEATKTQKPKNLRCSKFVSRNVARRAEEIHISIFKSNTFSVVLGDVHFYVLRCLLVKDLELIPFPLWSKDLDCKNTLLIVAKTQIITRTYSMNITR